MSLENAKANLEEFGKELKLEGLAFDENNTCILGIDNTFSLHLTFEPNSDRLYLYSPLLDGLPKDDKIMLKLLTRLLEGSMLGGQMAGGGVGLAAKEELILMHATLDMGLGAAANALRYFAGIFIETVEKWREIVTKICSGEEPPAFTLPYATPHQGPVIGSSKPSSPSTGGAGGPYIKI